MVASSVFPNDEAVDGHGDVIELHAAVGIESFLIVEHDAKRLHHEPHRPHPDAGAVFEDDVCKAERGRCEVKPIEMEHLSQRLKSLKGSGRD